MTEKKTTHDDFLNEFYNEEDYKIDSNFIKPKVYIKPKVTILKQKTGTFITRGFSVAGVAKKSNIDCVYTKFFDNGISFFDKTEVKK